MNQTIENLCNRASCRSYLDKPVEDEIIEAIAKAGTGAPSGLNRQPAIILAITNKEVIAKLDKLNAKVMGNEDAHPFYGAPAVLVVLASKSTPIYLYDGSLVAGNILNAAYSLGLGACWIHRAKEVFEMEEGKQILKDLGVEGEYEGIANCIVGYPAVELAAKPKKDSYVYYIK